MLRAGERVRERFGIDRISAAVRVLEEQPFGAAMRGDVEDVKRLAAQRVADPIERRPAFVDEADPHAPEVVTLDRPEKNSELARGVEVVVGGRDRDEDPQRAVDRADERRSIRHDLADHRHPRGDAEGEIVAGERHGLPWQREQSGVIGAEIDDDLALGLRLGDGLGERVVKPADKHLAQAPPDLAEHRGGSVLLLSSVAEGPARAKLRPQQLGLSDRQASTALKLTPADDQVVAFAAQSQRDLERRRGRTRRPKRRLVARRVPERLEDRVADPRDIARIAAHPRRQERRQLGLGPMHDRDQEGPRIATRGMNPAQHRRVLLPRPAINSLRRHEDERPVSTEQALLHLEDHDITAADLPGVEPQIDARGPQRHRELPRRRLVRGAVDQVDARGLTLHSRSVHVFVNQARI
jgi:hypothetical protein